MENDFIRDYLQGLKDGDHWIGLTDENIEGIWQWYDTDTALSYSDWAHGEPNSDHHDEDCAAVWSGLDYHWADLGCLEKYQALCEISACVQSRGLVVIVENVGWSETGWQDSITFVCNVALTDMAELQPSPSADITHEGSFFIKKDAYTVILTPTTLTWRKTVVKNSVNSVTTEVPISEILSAKTSCSNKVGDIDCLNVCYAKHLKKNVLRKTVVVFKGPSDACIEWATCLQRYLDDVAQRPRKMLVFVNPVSGSSKGRQTYMKTVAPIFQEANIHTDVIVTERPHHTEEVLATFDLESIDSIVLVGGDGLYHELANGLIRRKATDANVDINDPEIALPDIDIPIGIVPCGTGNGVAEGCHGTKDIETSALSIIIGKTNENNILAVFSVGELIAFSALLVGYGMWGDIIYMAESRRSQGILRYPIAIGEWVFVRTSRQLNVSIAYRTASACQGESDPPIGIDNASDLPIAEKNALSNDSDPPSAKKNELSHDSDPPKDIKQEQEESTKQSATKTSTGDGFEIEGKTNKADTTILNECGKDWTIIDSTYIGLMFLPLDFFQTYISQGSDVPSGKADTTRVVLTKPCSKWSIMKFMFQLMSLDPSALLNNPYLETATLNECKIKLKNVNADLDSELSKKEHVLNIDGEVFKLKKPEFHLKLHSRKVKLFSNVSSDWILLPKSQR